MRDLHIALMEHGDIQESANVLSFAMLDNPLHIAIFQGNGESERIEIERMFCTLFHEFPGIVFLAKEGRKIIGVMRMKSCVGQKSVDGSNEVENENDIRWRKSVWRREWARHDPLDQHWHLGPIGVLPSHRGKGIGSQLMRRFCREVDACSAIAYLETDLDENVRFYAKFGFKVVANSMIFDVDNCYMVRVAQI